MFSVDWSMAAWPSIGLEWLHIANTKTEGLLDVILAVMVLVPAVLAVWSYMQSSDGGDR